MKTIHTTSQMTLDFEPGLAERHETLMDCVRQTAYSNRKPLKSIAMDMDLSQSDLSRKLSQNPDDPRRFTVDDLEKFINSTGDLSPIYYLVEKYLTDEEAKQKRAAAEIMRQMPKILELVKMLGVDQAGR